MDDEDELPPPTGVYFFYGTLMDPGVLSTVLRLPSPPILRPARISGWTCKRVGQYPALILSEDQEEVVEGAAYEVQTPEHAARLAPYETSNYMTVPCEIVLTDGEQEQRKSVVGWVFEFVGDARWLKEGKFSLEEWLRKRGKDEVGRDLEARKI